MYYTETKRHKSSPKKNKGLQPQPKIKKKKLTIPAWKKKKKRRDTKGSNNINLQFLHTL